MDKSEILKRSRAENRFGDEKMTSEVGAAIQISQSVGCILCLLFGVLACIFLPGCKAVYYACFAILFGMESVERWLCVRSMPNKFRLFAAIVLTLFFIAFLIGFVYHLCSGVC